MAKSPVNELSTSDQSGCEANRITAKLETIEYSIIQSKHRRAAFDFSQREVTTVRGRVRWTF